MMEDDHTAETNEFPWEGGTRTLLEQLADGDLRCGLTFAGQANPYLDEIIELHADNAGSRELIDAAGAFLRQLVAKRDFAWSGLYQHGLDLPLWIASEADRPSAVYLSSSAISMAPIFIAQVARYVKYFHLGLDQACANGAVVVGTGHSQGVLAAALVAESPKGRISTARFLKYVEYLAWQGIYMQQTIDLDDGRIGEASPMAAVANITREELRQIVERLNKTLPTGATIAISLENTRTRNVVSGPAESLERLHAVLALRQKQLEEGKKAGKMAGSTKRFTWEYFAVSTPFHSHHMARGLEKMRAKVRELGFTIQGKDFDFAVLDPSSGLPLNAVEDVDDAIMQSQYTKPVRWQQSLDALAETRGLTHVLCFGPADGVSKLTASVLRGRGLQIVSLTTEAGHRALVNETSAGALDYRAFAPSLVQLPDGRVQINNRFTQATGSPPILLPGMTPTTVEAPLVAAAANGGFVAELAGGGQVTERILRLRAAELAQILEPGKQVVFNALYLDAYLWRLHFGEQAVVTKLALEGAPFSGVTISAGVPPLDEAVDLLDTLHAAGLWLNAFKPGTEDQVKAVLKIADARPGRALFLHLEGGKAGGHHSWESLDDLLLATYQSIRTRPNVVLCVGGGVASEARAAELLCGDWSLAYDMPRMPVDAVFLGTLAMAAKEAFTSPAVKQALVDAKGTPAWVHAGESDGAVTSGKSSLNADIHYLDNRAARAGALLDQVAGDADAVAARRDEIIHTLNQTAKPYFGELEQMTYAEVSERLFALLATGRQGVYEDGHWPDISFRERAAAWIWCAEARLVDQEEGDFRSVLDGLAQLDDPSAALAQFLTAYPQARNTRLHPLDRRQFVDVICKRPGKPVPFVPVIDADVRRWYKADSLNQCHDDRFEADQVLVIPGPEAVAGILRVDEPIVELLGRFETAVIEGLLADGVHPESLERLPSLSLDGLEPGFRWYKNGASFQYMDGSGAVDWLRGITDLPGPLSAFFAAPRVFVGARAMDNPAHALCAPDRGMRMHLLDGPDGEIDGLICRGDREKIAIRCDRQGATVEISPRLAEGAEATYTLRFDLRNGAYVSEPEAAEAELARFYQLALFGDAAEPSTLFQPVESSVLVDAEVVRAYAAVTAMGGRSQVPLNMAFSLGWKALFGALSCPELRGGMLKLVHLGNQFSTGPAFPILPGQTVSSRAAVTRVENGNNGRTVTTTLAIERDGVLAVRVGSQFFIRDTFATEPHRLQERQELDETVSLSASAAAFLNRHPLLALTEALTAGDEVRLVAALTEVVPRQGPAHYTAQGKIWRGTREVGEIRCDSTGVKLHPVRALLDVIQTVSPALPTPSRTLSTTTVPSPRDMEAFAWVGSDRNPIHTSPAMARMAGLDRPIVHGMWTSARVHAHLVEALGGGKPQRVTTYETKFLAPVLPGEDLRISVKRTAIQDGAITVEAMVVVARDESWIPVMRATAVIAPARVAYVFPGQGIQQKGMGMDGYSRSAPARAIWNRADVYTREHLGFSILTVVRTNPNVLFAGGTRFAHPGGVLHLTQFTQVAMAVLAQAQMAELRAASAISESAIAAGHSVGEYNALGAFFGVLPLEGVVELVWQRGSAMHALVPRDATGESGYRMGVIRPHYAGLDEAGAEALVDAVRAQTESFIQIVNYNVRGRQYAVTGRVKALNALSAALTARARGDQPPYIEVPGIDVPFHSSELRDGVAAMRLALDKWLPRELAPERLLGRYIPNLVPRPFTLDRGFIEEVVAVSGSHALTAVLTDYEAALAKPALLTRLLVVELLSYQFASPVRWIETQDLLLQAGWAGGLDLESVIEVGVGYQPTLANMARYSSTLGQVPSTVRIANVETDADAVFQRDTDVVVPAEAEEAPAAAPAAPAAPVPTASTVTEAPMPVVASAAMPADKPVPLSEALVALVALQAKLRPAQIAPDESVEELFEGVSSRINQLMLDIGNEFSVGAIDSAQTLPLTKLTGELEGRCAYTSSGPYLRAAQDEAIKRVFGPAGLSRAEVSRQLGDRFGFGPGFTDAALNRLTLNAREGRSTRDGELATLPTLVKDKAEAGALIEQLAASVAHDRGFSLPSKAAAAGGATADPAALNALDQKITGTDGVLMKTLRDLAGHLGHPVRAPEASVVEPVAAFAVDPAYAKAIAPLFNADKHLALTSGWAWAQRDVARLAFEAESLSAGELTAEARRLQAFAADSRVADTARWYASQRTGDIAKALASIAEPAPIAPVAWAPTRPGTDASGAYAEVPGGSIASFVDGLAADLGAFDGPYRTALKAGADAAWNFSGRTAVITGAGPTGIATWIARHLLRGGARVVLTTSSFGADRLDFYRRLYAECGGPGAELHVVPFNQASTEDIDALTTWLFDPMLETVGGKAKVLKEAWVPDILVPFAAIKDLATMDGVGISSEVALRAMLLNVERLIGGFATAYRERGHCGRCHTLLPLSPNHGIFGGDGAYGESKAGLEVVAAKWLSEQHAWGKYSSLAPVTIGWVRGTALMDANDPVAARLEQHTGVQTYSGAEMGFLLAGLCTDVTRESAGLTPIRADLAGGLGALHDLSQTVDGIRGSLGELAETERAQRTLAEREAALLDAAQTARILRAVPGVVPICESLPDCIPGGRAPKDTVVIVGIGEVGPCGNTRTRFALEVGAELSAGAVLELAWITGMVFFDTRLGSWADVESGKALSEGDIAETYRERVAGKVGIRWVEPDVVGFDADAIPVYAKAHLDRDFTFTVSSREEARSFKEADPDNTFVECDPDDGTWRVTRMAGSEIRVLRRGELTRKVAGQVPSGFDFARYGIPGEMVENVDSTALFNLIATVDAFVNAGLEPEELMRWVHPARVANTQGTGIGGIRSLARLYIDPVLDRERQKDILQETLINVVAGYVVQSYVGSYGAMSNPVAACATAAVSLEAGAEKILAGKADFVVTGGIDDLGVEGMRGFADMNATADTDQMTAMGMAPHEMSRANDARRRGFVEAQGGGTILLARGDVAVRMGLPIRGVVAYASSFADGIHTSVPAPGMGALAAACGGVDSPLANALASHGLTADDIAVVYKHDTSTGANDPNENALHHQIQVALGRTPGNPLFAVSQKTVTGHSKGGAAAWQINGLCQSLVSGTIPGNRNLSCVDEDMRGYQSIAFSDQTLQTSGLRAGLLTSLGFGHVSALALILHPDVFLAAIPESDRAGYLEKLREREAHAESTRLAILLGDRAAYSKRTERRLGEGTESAMLLDPSSRFDPALGAYRSMSES